MKRTRHWRLQTFLAFMLAVTLLTILLVIDSVTLLIRIPQINAENQSMVQYEVKELINRVELLMDALQTRIEPLRTALNTLEPQQTHELLATIVQDGSAITALYIVSPQGVVAALETIRSSHTHHQELIGTDLSANLLYRTAQATGKAVWSDRYLSAISGDLTIGIAIPSGTYTVIAEIPTSYLLHTLNMSRTFSNDLIWVIDHRGELIVDTDVNSQVGMTNFLGLPILQKVQNGEPFSSSSFIYKGRSYYTAVEHSQLLNWYFVVRRPSGLGDRRIRANVMRTAISLFAGLPIMVLLAPLWASHMARPLLNIMERARQVAAGRSHDEWPRGFIREFNRLSFDLERMSKAISEREQKILAIFDASPVAMMVCDTDLNFALVDVNHAWVEQFRRSRAEVLGRTPMDIGLSIRDSESDDYSCVFETCEDFASHSDIWLLCGDGDILLYELSARQVIANGHRLMIWVMEDVTQQRRIEQEIRILNTELEAHVEARTEELADANHELSETLEHLRHTQKELVQAEKFAALGELVAGVAHELNTPIGNALMAASTLGEKVSEFRGTMQQGLRRSLLEKFVAETEAAAGITTRNLHRAAELVTSFKQVAADQTSSERRSFDLRTVVDAILITLRPTLKRTPHQIIPEIPEGLFLDSYPGPLEQVLVNLINNAVIHAFAENQAGLIRITAGRINDGRVSINVIDNGKGIPADAIDRIFNPFFTTQKGKGGTGLGLHIAYNIVASILGGTLAVFSTEGQGCTFEIAIPKNAPHITAEAVHINKPYQV